MAPYSTFRIALATCVAVVTVHAEPVLVNFTDSVYLATGREDSKALRQMQDTVYPLSALRNPVEGTVKVFFEAQAYIARHFSCEFTKDLLSDGFHGSGVLQTEGGLQQVGGIERQFTGYMFDCQDPGPDYSYFAFISVEDNSGLGRVLLKSLKVSTVDTEPAGVGWCVSSLYSPRIGFANWARSTLRAGFSQIYVYYTHVRDREAISPHYGTSDSHGDFVPDDIAHVQYHYFETPAQTWTFGESTMYTECIHRNRLKHKFLAIADSDELFWRQPSDESLEKFLTRITPEDVASLVFADVHYPEACQEHRIEAHGVDPLQDSHFYLPHREGTQPKSIVLPQRSVAHRVHTLAAWGTEYKCCKDLPPLFGYFKHIRQSGGRCGHQRHHLNDDRDADSFHKTMHNETNWVPFYG